MEVCVLKSCCGSQGLEVSVTSLWLCSGQSVIESVCGSLCVEVMLWKSRFGSQCDFTLALDNHCVEAKVRKSLCGSHHVEVIVWKSVCLHFGFALGSQCVEVCVEVIVWESMCSSHGVEVSVTSLWLCSGQSVCGSQCVEIIM